MPEFERPALVTDELPTGDVVEADLVPDRASRALVAVLIAAGVALGVAGEPQAPMPRPAVESIETRPTPVSLQLPSVGLDLPGDVAMFDIDASGYAALVSVDCGSGPVCATGLAVSDDLRHWVRRPLPSGLREYGVPVPTVLGYGVVLLQSFDLRPRAWYSDNGARTWRSAPTRPGRPVAHARWGRLVVEPLDQPGFAACGAQRLVVYSRGTGGRAPLRRQPPLLVCPDPPLVNVAGRLWVAGLDPAPGRAAVVAESADLGEHWRTVRLPATEGARHVSLTSDGQYVYALVNGSDHFPWSATAAFRYDGDHWTAIWRAHGGEPVRINQVMVCRDGLLLATWWPDGSNRSRLVFSRDYGRNWYAAARPPGISAASVPHHGWYGWFQSRSQRRPVYSYDCEHWYGLPVE